MDGKLLSIAENKPKLQKFLDLVYRIVVMKESGPLEVNFSEGGVTSAFFKKKEL